MLLTFICNGQVTVAPHTLLAIATVGLLDGTPVVVFEDGRWQDDRMNSVRIQSQDVRASAQPRTVPTVDHIKFAVAERNESLFIINRNDDERKPGHHQQQQQQPEFEQAS